MQQHPHWMRNLPGVDEQFIADFIEPIERLAAEAEQTKEKILNRETLAHFAAFRRWGEEAIAECFNKYV